MSRAASLVCVSLSALASASSPIASFRAPATPLLSQSPLVNVFSRTTQLNAGGASQWTGADVDMWSGVRVDGAFFQLLGAPAPGAAAAAQTAAAVWATQTKFSFAAGPVALNLTFTSPLIATDLELYSRPAHYVTLDAAATDGAAHDVAWYFDASPRLVMQDDAALVAFSRVPLAGGAAEALRMGAAAQAPLSSTNDKMTWGVAYVVRDAGVAGAAALASSTATRAPWAATGALPAADASSPQPLSNGGDAPATGPQPGVDRSGSDLPGSPFVLARADPNLCWARCNETAACLAWAYAVPGCDQYARPNCWLKGASGTPSAHKCRVSGAQAGAPAPGSPTVVAAVTYALPGVGAAPVRRRVTVAVDEILGIDWFGEAMPPFWRRALPLNDSSTPVDMLATAFAQGANVTAVCDAFDAATAAELSAVGGDEYATVAQLTYRQVWAGQMVVWSPSRATPWFFLKEISSCGCLQTADVVYPAFPQVLYYAPELARLWMVTHLEYAANKTSEPYPFPFAPHHLGYWPLANLPYTRQENMPLEETAWDLLILAAVAQRQGGDVAWLEPYWPVVQTWYDFLITLLPFPQEQLSTVGGGGGERGARAAQPGAPMINN